MRVLVTGATGSLGNALADRLLTDPALERLVIFSRDELKQAQMAERLGPHPALRFFLGDVRDRHRLVEAMYGITTVVNAAAMKRVDSIAYNPSEVIRTNVLGTMNVVQAAIEAGVSRVLLISSDKAVHATNIYGSSKFMAECYAVAANASGYPRGTRIAAVRYGNVLASRGSVVHIFRDAIAKGLPIPITDPRCTRFLLTLPQAVDVVLDALANMEGGEIWVPRLPSVAITDLAAAIGGADYPVKVVGLRVGGEKFHEQLLSDEEVGRTVQIIGSPLLLIRPAFSPWTDTVRDGTPVAADFVYRSDLNAWWLKGDELRRVVEGIE